MPNSSFFSKNSAQKCEYYTCLLVCFSCGSNGVSGECFFNLQPGGWRKHTFWTALVKLIKIIYLES